ncbi:MAG: helix-turn-helix transcriptional regulator, partial [Gammaproteobacteria bacterium]|nr:helix-turn-helix transcriptional regulator [Gammaproteobacteria bacterium]
TRAERHVLTLIVDGRGPLAVADTLGLSVHTVRAHLAHIYQKTDLHNQRELLAAVLRARVL